LQSVVGNVSPLVEGVYIDIPQKGSMRYVARRTAKGGFGPLLYALAEATGLSRAKPRCCAR
jgi:hypothetical protein